MTIDEAIEQYANAECGTCPTLFCEECVKGDKRQQIAEWLEELKAYKQNTDICHICDTYCSYLADEFENGYIFDYYNHSFHNNHLCYLKYIDL